jgi:hypothetical protein
LRDEEKLEETSLADYVALLNPDDRYIEAAALGKVSQYHWLAELVLDD